MPGKRKSRQRRRLRRQRRRHRPHPRRPARMQRGRRHQEARRPSDSSNQPLPGAECGSGRRRGAGAAFGACGDQNRRRTGRPLSTFNISSNGWSQWRIGAGGAVQHTADSGSTWRTQATGVNVTLAAGSSPSPSVCWLVGPGGLVLLTTNEGQSWRRVPFQVVTDLVSVRATDNRTATVVTSDGRTFVTADGGRSWRQ